jgi:cobalamin biosynthesis Co2+ chelatase CbiK
MVEVLSDDSVAPVHFKIEISMNKSRIVILFCHGGSQVLRNQFFSVNYLLDIVS